MEPSVAPCFIVCRDKIPFNVSRVHDTLDMARSEAERLSRKEQETFLVFALAGEYRIAAVPVIWVPVKAPEEESA